jgi:hypothetical protein
MTLTTKKITSRWLRLLLFSAVLAVMVGATAAEAADSLYDRYTTASADTFTKETSKMISGLQKTFRQEDIEGKEQQIDLADYAAHLEKAAVYATRLAAYSQKDEDLRFARDRELFQGLPEKSEDPEERRLRKEFVDTKYDRMRQNVEEEIATYSYLVLISIEECEAKMDGDLGSGSGDAFVMKLMQRRLNEKPFQDYAEIKSSLKETWPDLERRISFQIASWSGAGGSPNSPILSTAITGAL